MPNIQIRDVPPGVHRRLKTQAAAEGQSLNDFLKARMEEIAETPTWPELIARLREREPYTGPSLGEIAEVVREDRDSR